MFRRLACERRMEIPGVPNRDVCTSRDPQPSKEFDAEAKEAGVTWRICSRAKEDFVESG
jgi:hypothetical protein